MHVAKLSSSSLCVGVYRELIVIVACSILAVANCQLSQSDLQSQACEITVRVDSRVENNNWRDLYREYQETKSNYSSLNLTSSDLQEALLALNTTVFHRTNDCVEIIISQGSYSVNQSVYMRQNVRIIGEVPGEVLVDFESLTVPENSSSSITIYGSDSVVISGINFTTSPGIIFIERVTIVEVTNCSFQFFSFGPLDIYHCLFVRVHSCFFANNGFEEIIKYGYQFRGHAGGLSVGFDDGHYSDIGTSVGTELKQYSILIMECIFRNNTSKSPGNVPVLSLFQSYTFAGRGGALTLLLNSTTSFDVLIRDCEFIDNTAIFLGGGIYIVLNRDVTHNAVLDKLRVERNRCLGLSGAGVYVLFLGEGDRVLFSGQNIGIFNSTIIDNVSPTAGGGVYIEIFNVTNLVPMIGNKTQAVWLASIKNCIFKGNNAYEFGSAISHNIASALEKISNNSNLLIEDCIFEKNNGGRGGVVSIAYLSAAFSGTNKFHRNSGHVLLINGARIEVRGSLRFVNNTPSLHGLESGSLYVFSFAQLQLFSGAELIFKNNSGILGASIAGDDVSKFSGSFAKTTNNPLCVLSSENATDSPENWNIKIHFSENKALIGSAVLLSNIDICSWTGTNMQNSFNRERVFHWDFVNLVNDNVNRAHIPEETNPQWSVQTLATRIISRTPNVTAYPGEKFSVKLDGFDEYNQPIIVPVRLSDPSGEYRFSPSAFFPDNVNSPNIESTFSVETKSNFATNKTIIAEVIYSDTAKPLRESITLYTLPCPIGFKLQPIPEDRTRSFCMCNDEDSINIQNCRADNTLILTDGLWGVGNLDVSGDRLTTYPCPQHYCQCIRADNVTRADNKTRLFCQYLFDPKQSDRQCFWERKGVLCGDCADESTGFSALLNKCKSCGVANLLLIIALLVFDVLVIGGLVIFLRTDLHTWFYPCLFYLQIIPYLTFYFPVTFEVVHPYVYYVSSATSFYFIYDFCLGPHFSPLIVYFIRLLPSIITISVAVPVIITRYSFRLKISSRVPGLWLVVLLQYTHVIHTCMSVLNCPMLPGFDGITKPRWFINGNIDCFTRGHIPLALLSIVLLVVFVIIVPTMMLFVFLRSKKRGWLYNIIVPSSDAYIKKYPWWGVLELLRRVVILIFAVALPDIKFWVIFFMIIVVGIYLFVQPYKTRTTNIIEALLATNMLVLLFMPNIDDDSLKLDEFIKLRDYSSDECIDSAVHTITRRAIMLTPCYYVPLFVIILASAFCTLRLIMAKVKAKKRSEDLTTSDYYLLNEGNVAAAATSTVVDVDDDKTLDPLSRLWTSVHRKNSKKNISKRATEVNRSLKTRRSSLALQVQTENTSNKNTSRQRETVI